MAVASLNKGERHTKMAKQPKQPKRLKQQKRGPKPDVLVLDGEWEHAVKRALAKRRPKAGWPKPPKGRGK